MKSDNPAHIGNHTFEVQGLGKGPFRCIGFVHRVGPIRLACGSELGAPGQPMGTCDYCGNGIADCFVIESADKKRFEAGCKCVEKTDDRGLIKAYKNRPEYRKHKREMRHAREAKKIAAIPMLLEVHAKALAATPHPNNRRAAKGESMLDHACWIMNNAGNAGKCKLHTALNKFQAGTPAELKATKARLAAAKQALAAKEANAEQIAKDEAKAREAVNAATLAKNAPLIQVLRHTGGGFAADIAKELETKPVADLSPRVCEILTDIWAKSHGRRNSKAYDAAYDQFEELF